MRKRRWMICAALACLAMACGGCADKKKEANTAIISRNIAAERTRPVTPRRMRIMMTVWADLPEHSVFRPV